MVYTRPAHGDPFADSSATDATVIIDALADGLEAAESTISSHTSSIALKANIASPTFTGTAAAPTPAVATDSTTLATTAFVGLRSRVTHPNTDDVLVQVWDVANARWQVAHYDSGWRNVSSLLINSWTVTAILIRRINNDVTLAVDRIIGVGTFGTSWMTPPTGFVPLSTTLSYSVMRESAITGDAVWVGATNTSPNLYGGRITGGAWSTLHAASGVLNWRTNDAVPGSLPGTLSVAAPYA